jgi:hypothetical protein
VQPAPPEVQERINKCLHGGESLLALERVTVGNSSGAAPMVPGTNPFAWLGLSDSRVVTLYEGSGDVVSHRLGQLQHLEIKRGLFSRRLVWRGPIAFEGESAKVSREFAEVAQDILANRDRWPPLDGENTSFAVRTETVDNGDLRAVADTYGLGTDRSSVYCGSCGAWCGGTTEEGKPESDECPSCLRRLVV